MNASRARSSIPAAARQADLDVVDWLDGGTFDPESGAPKESRGELDSIATTTPGVRFCDSLCERSAGASSFAVVWRFRATLVALLVVASSVTSHADDASRPPVKIVTLGDSITKGVRKGVTGRNTFPAIVEAGLRKRGLAVDVINVGMGGDPHP